ncbi:MAG: hypothetical protein EAY66_09595 [Sphingobacteriales bacterium]|jgi:hypothetical protein|nr:MAG: hypothetical protein EAY66_09595 [Sphingobacteriales bacterium]
MKKYLLMALLLNSPFAQAQKKAFDSDNLSCFSIGAGYKSFIGNNFLAKTYNNRVSFVYDFNFRLYKKWGAGTFYRTTQAKPFTNQYVGNSVYARITELGFYATYYQKINGRWLFSPKVGFSTFLLKNQIKSPYQMTYYNYFTRGTNFFIAPEINYFITKGLRVFANTEYGFINMPRVTANKAATGTSYNAANQVNFCFGFKVGF